MPDDSTPPPDLSNLGGIDINALLKLMGGTPTVQMPQVQGGPSGQPGLLGQIGEAMGGSAAGVVPMSGQQRDAQGMRNIINFFGGMAAHPVGGWGPAIAGGIGAAEESAQQPLLQEQELTKLAGAQQDIQLNKVKAATDLLNTQLELRRLQLGASMPNPLLGGNQPQGGPTVAGKDPAASLPKEAALAAVMQRESGGQDVFSNIKVPGKAPDQLGSGYYQIIPSTWTEGAKLAGVDTGKYPIAKGAPFEVQHAVASALYDKYGLTPWAQSGPATTTPTVSPAVVPAGKASPAAPSPTVQMGGAPPPPPGGPAGGPTGAGGIGAALAATAPNGPQYTVAPPPVIKAQPIHAGVLQSTGKPPGQASLVPGDVGAMLQGVRLAQATPAGPMFAGPGALPATTTPPAAPPVAPTAEPGWGSKVGAYSFGGPTAAPTPTPPTPTPATTTPTPTPTPQVTTQAQQPPTPPGAMSFEDFQKLHPVTIPTTAVTVDQAALSAAENAKAAAAQTLSMIRSGLSTADPNKATQAYTDASNNVAKLQQEAQSKTLELQQAAQKNALDTQRQLYNDEMQRQQAAALKNQELAQQVAENEKNRQNQLKIEQTKAGMTLHQKIEEQNYETAQTNTIKPMAEQALKAHQMNLSLAQLQPILQDLPPGGGSVGMLLDAHPDLAPLLNSAGVLNDRSADAVRLVNGLVANISSQMKPTGLGALREYEWDAFKAQLPSMLSTPAGQQKAVALIMNMNNRIQDESGWMNNYFTRKVPDETTPGATRSANNLEAEGKESVQQRMDRELGPIVPSYTGPPTGSGQAQWESSLPPGKPYYKMWAVPDPKNPGQPLRDANGNPRTTTTLEVRPWQ